VNSLPAISITSDKGASIVKGAVARLTASAGAGSYTYSWIDADGIIGGKETPVLEVKPTANTVYEVTATNSAGCSNHASFSLKVSGALSVIPNNILTPNGDGINDRWVVRNVELYPDNEVKIFDRTGRLVYSRMNYNNDWDGTANGKQLAEGTYYYFLTLNNGTGTVKGFVTIVRDIH
jgi:gliding motility-associated-like protein